MSSSSNSTPTINKLIVIIGGGQLTGSSATGIYCGRILGGNFFPKEITLPGFEPQTYWLRVGDSTPMTQRPHHPPPPLGISSNPLLIWLFSLFFRYFYIISELNIPVLIIIVYSKKEFIYNLKADLSKRVGEAVKIIFVYVSVFVSLFFI